MRYQVTITGLSALLMHHDNLAWGEVLKSWERVPANKKSSTPGDDRSPAWRWLGNCYHDGTVLAIPSDNLMTMLREGGKGIPTGKRGATFKAATQSGILVDQVAWPLVVRGKAVAWADLLTYAGAFCGLGDWRPSNALKSPGPFGRFTAQVKAL